MDPRLLIRRGRFRQSVLSHAREDLSRAPDSATLSWRRRATAEYPRPSTSTMPEMRFWCGLGRMSMQQPKLYWLDLYRQGAATGALMMA